MSATRSTARNFSKLSKLEEIPNEESLGSTETSDYVVPERKINHREELILYFCDQMLPSIVVFWEVLDFDIVKSTTSEHSSIAEKDRFLSVVSSHTKSQMYKKLRPGTGSTFKSELTSVFISYRASRQGFNVSKLVTVPSDSLTINTMYDWMVPCSEEFVHIVFKNDNEYVGPVVNKMMHGKGIYVWDEGAYYDGEFVNGAISGEGVLKYTECSYYQGQFCNGMLHGMGAFYPITTTMVYNGEWKYGKKHGKGWMLYGTGDYYDGEWTSDYKDGVGYRQYSNGTIYKGQWKNGLPDGKGMAYFNNSDFYKGDWHRGLPHGSGEYTWKAGIVRGLTLTIENRYKGMWMNGKREGQGILHFGMEGTKLRSKFKGNQKHGTGIITCGDGTILRKSPLFWNDKIAHRTVQSTTSRMSNPLRQQSLKSLQSLRSKRSSLISCRESVTYKMKSQAKCTPLAVPVHGTAAYIDVEEHVSKLIMRYMVFKDDPHSFGQNPSTWKLSLLTGTNFNIEHRQYININYEFEERKLRNSILYNYQILQNLYTTYASLTYSCSTLKPALSRLLLWQMCRDLNLHKTGLSIIQIDKLLFSFPDSAVESKHNPFEIIYFWQFMHLILLISWEYYCAVDYFDKHKDNGIYAQMLKDFIKDFVCPNFGNFKGEALFKYKDLLPINGVYSLYKSVGEPHSARTFLRKCCVKKMEQPMCYLSIASNEKMEDVFSGTNAVCTGTNVIYLPEESCDVLERPRQKCECPFERDAFYQDLKIFRSLGPKRILYNLCQVCPLIKTDNLISNIGYELTFLEFYEVLLLLSLEYIAERKKEEEDLLRTAKVSKEVHRMSTKSVISNRSRKDSASVTSRRKGGKVKK